MTPTLRVALGEYDTGWHDPAGSLARAERVVRAAARGGAQLVVLPEMCTTGFTMDAAAHAEALEGPSVRALARIASEAGVHLLAGVAVRECVAGAECAVNAAILFGDDGAMRAIYRKQRVFGYAGEDRVYTPGAEEVTAEVHGVRIALFVCYDLRFPELFRRVAGNVDAMVIIANWPARRRAHWDTLMRARAIENQCYVVAVNRRGEGGGISYDGGSAAFDPWGERLVTTDDAVAVVDGAAPPMVDVDPARVRAVRAEYPFLRDYQG
jgi:predicted amidohydrolase